MKKEVPIWAWALIIIGLIIVFLLAKPYFSEDEEVVVVGDIDEETKAEIEKLYEGEPDFLESAFCDKYTCYYDSESYDGDGYLNYNLGTSSPVFDNERLGLTIIDKLPNGDYSLITGCNNIEYIVTAEQYERINTNNDFQAEEIVQKVIDIREKTLMFEGYTYLSREEVIDESRVRFSVSYDENGEVDGSAIFLYLNGLNPCINQKGYDIVDDWIEEVTGETNSEISDFINKNIYEEEPINSIQVNGYELTTEALQDGYRVDLIK